MEIIFFFSSRRRHTRYWRDWSSDVCSSDLRELRLALGEQPAVAGPAGLEQPLPLRIAEEDHLAQVRAVAAHLGHHRPVVAGLRSEERRVGKECRSRWSPYH